jgi:hypothetical protein
VDQDGIGSAIELSHIESNVDELASKVQGVRESRAAIAAQLGVGETTVCRILPSAKAQNY